MRHAPPKAPASRTVLRKLKKCLPRENRSCYKWIEVSRGARPNSPARSGSLNNSLTVRLTEMSITNAKTCARVMFLALAICVVLLALKSNSAKLTTGNEVKGPAPLPHTLTGNIRYHRAFHSQFLPRDRDIIVYLPPGYDKNPTARYPVLYMQDGQNISDAATSFFHGMERHLDEHAESLITEGAIRPLIIVGIYSTGLDRINEYTPTRQAGTNKGGEADLYGRMLVAEIRPFIEARYRTLRGPSNTGLGGASLGGLLTAYVGLKYPTIFGRLAISSPAAYWDDEVIVRYVRSLHAKTNQHIWLAIGTAEPQVFLSSTRSLHEALIDRGWKDGVDLGYMEAAGAEHNPEARSRRVDRLLGFLFPSTNKGKDKLNLAGRNSKIKSAD
jgi:predicted alpha/beta superfamily hydrolase